PPSSTHAGYTQAVDWWSLGTVCFEMLYGSPPFYDPNFSKMCNKILRQPLRFPRRPPPPPGHGGRAEEGRGARAEEGEGKGRSQGGETGTPCPPRRSLRKRRPSCGVSWRNLPPDESAPSSPPTPLPWSFPLPHSFVPPAPLLPECNPPVT
ncbi:protein kinase, partial [Nannochloropsis gaditana]